MVKDKSVTVRMPEQQKKLVHRLAESMGLSEAEIMRFAFLSLADDVGLIEMVLHES